MIYGCITVKCPRCDSNIQIICGSIPADIFTCPVCMEGEIYHKADQPTLRPIAACRQNSQRLEQYITTASNIWTN